MILLREILVSGLRRISRDLKVSVRSAPSPNGRRQCNSSPSAFPGRRARGRGDLARHHPDRHRAFVDFRDSHHLYRVGNYLRASLDHIVEDIPAVQVSRRARQARAGGTARERQDPCNSPGSASAIGKTEGKLSIRRRIQSPWPILPAGSRRAVRIRLCYSRNPQIVRAAIDHEHVKPDTVIAGAREIAFFPPMNRRLRGAR